MSEKTVYEIMEMMGAMATDEEGRAMRDILDERNLDPDEMTDREFAALIPEAIERAKIEKMYGYRTAWYTQRELALIADFLNAQLNEDRVTSAGLWDETGTDGHGTIQFCNGGYGANVENKLINMFRVPPALAVAALRAKIDRLPEEA